MRAEDRYHWLTDGLALEPSVGGVAPEGWRGGAPRSRTDVGEHGESAWVWSCKDLASGGVVGARIK